MASLHTSRDPKLGNFWGAVGTGWRRFPFSKALVANLHSSRDLNKGNFCGAVHLQGRFSTGLFPKHSNGSGRNRDLLRGHKPAENRP